TPPAHAPVPHRRLSETGWACRERESRLDSATGAGRECEVLHTVDQPAERLCALRAHVLSRLGATLRTPCTRPLTARRNAAHSVPMYSHGSAQRCAPRAHVLSRLGAALRTPCTRPLTARRSAAHSVHTCSHGSVRRCALRAHVLSRLAAALCTPHKRAL